VPLHRHAVELDFVRLELVAAYSLTERWDAWLRVPYDVKDRTASIELVDPATPDEVAAMQRNLDIHHPSETLEGFSDLSLLLAWRRAAWLREGDLFTLALGTSLPVGRTEEDPYELGDAGLPHEHVQFGTGTFDPLVELYYYGPMSDRLGALVSLTGRLPLYENDKGYQGPVEVSSNLSLALEPVERLSLRTGLSLFYQGYAHWDGDRDVNTGLYSSGVVAGASYRLTDAVDLSLDARVPLTQETLSDDGDTFEQGTVLQLGLSWSF